MCNSEQVLALTTVMTVDQLNNWEKILNTFNLGPHKWLIWVRSSVEQLARHKTRQREAGYRPGKKWLAQAILADAINLGSRWLVSKSRRIHPITTV